MKYKEKHRILVSIDFLQPNRFITLRRLGMFVGWFCGTFAEGTYFSFVDEMSLRRLAPIWWKSQKEMGRQENGGKDAKKS